ncbi:MAG TPA: Maf family nucleotide pyrophosphatase [Rudaea sp.]|nr:Maf family nucleotide pyrophosphatase [Rudaea sp.]
MTALADVDLVLASTSRYRRELLSRLTSRVRQLAPDVDETPQPGEAPAALAGRLAEAKARAVAARSPGALVIGSDQVADLDGRALGKPGDAATARAQLAACAGRDVVFHTAVCVVDARTAPLWSSAAVDVTRVRFRALTADEIARYVEREQPLDCAGSFKSEGLGIALFESIESHDPTALVGLPLIALCRVLRGAGIAIP